MPTGVQGQRIVSSTEILMAIAENGGVGYGLDFFNCDLRKVELRKANLSGANLQQTSLQESDLTLAIAEDAKMRESCLERADLRGANLRGADLQDTRLSGANLQGVKLGGTYLHGAEIRGAKNITRVEIEEGPGEEIGPQRNYLHAKEVYLSLKNYFLDVGRYDDAGWAFVQERRMERETYFPPRAHIFYGKELVSAIELNSVLERALRTPYVVARKWWFYLKYTWKWISSWLYDLRH